MGLALFENYSATSDRYDGRGRFAPLIVDMFVDRAVDMIERYINSHDFEEILVNRDYKDIYATRGKFEYSFQVYTNGGRTYVAFSVYGEKARGRTRKELTRIYREMNDLFGDYLNS